MDNSSWAIVTSNYWSQLRSWSEQQALAQVKGSNAPEAAICVASLRKFYCYGWPERPTPQRPARCEAAVGSGPWHVPQGFNPTPAAAAPGPAAGPREDGGGREVVDGSGGRPQPVFSAASVAGQAEWGGRYRLPQRRSTASSALLQGSWPCHPKFCARVRFPVSHAIASTCSPPNCKSAARNLCDAHACRLPKDIAADVTGKYFHSRLRNACMIDKCLRLCNTITLHVSGCSVPGFSVPALCGPALAHC